MLFASIDYLCFLTQKGRYSRKNEKEPMAYAFEESIPEDVVNSLQIGDIILQGSFNCWLYWAIMYYTNSLINHCAVYIGNRQILHVTLSGSVKEPIESLYGKRTRLIIARFRLPVEKQIKQVQVDNYKYVGIPYSKKVVFEKFLSIITGKNWPHFHWKFYLDILILFLIMDIPFLYFLKIPIFLIIPLLLFCLILVNAILWHFNPISLSALGAPSDLLYSVVKNLGIVILDQNRLKESEESSQSSKRK